MVVIIGVHWGSPFREIKRAPPCQRKALLGEWNKLAFKWDSIVLCLAVKVFATVIANLLDVIPDITCAEVHPALVRRVLVLALRILEHLQEVRQADLLAALACALALIAKKIASELLMVVVHCYAYGNIGFAIAVLAAIKDINFEHVNSFLAFLSLKTKKPVSTR